MSLGLFRVIIGFSLSFLLQKTKNGRFVFSESSDQTMQEHRPIVYSAVICLRFSLARKF